VCCLYVEMLYHPSAFSGCHFPHFITDNVLDSFKTITLIMLFAAGSEETPSAMSHRNHGRIVYAYEPLLGTIVWISVHILIFSCDSIMIEHVTLCIIVKLCDG